MNRFENGFDSLKKAIKGLTKDNIDEFDLKDIIINFHHSIEVLFKYILFSKNEFLMYENIDKVIEQKFNMKYKNNENEHKEKFCTVTFSESIKRIAVFFNETIDKYTYNKIENLNEYRNGLMHDELDLVKEKVNQLIISILPTIIMILQKHLPEEHREEFLKFIEDKQIIIELNKLYADNDKWRLITIINLLTAYKKQDDYMQFLSENNINRMLSFLGCKIIDDDMLTNIDGSYYIATNSYLKQQVCDYLVLDTEKMKEYIKDETIKKLFYKNEMIYDICKEYIYNMACYLTVLKNIDGDDITLFKENEGKIADLFDDRSLSDNIDIYEILFYINKTAQSYIDICDNKKRREKMLKEIILYENVSVYDIYSCFIKWFKNKKWYNSINYKYIPDEPKNIFLNDEFFVDKINKEIPNKISQQDIIDDLSGKWSYINSIDEYSAKKIDIIIQDLNNCRSYTVILDVLIKINTDNNCNNKTDQIYIAVDGEITNDNKFSISKFKYLGYKNGINGFAFK